LLSKVLLAPLRLAVGWGMYPRFLGWLGVAMLVMLRLTLGWHFFSEGFDKYRQGSWDAKPFFSTARGPAAGQFRQLVWDYDGSLRLDVERTKVHFAIFRDRVIRHFDFDESQQRQAQANYKLAVEQLEWVLDNNKTDIEEYELGRERIARLEQDWRRTGVASLAGQRDAIRAEWTAKINPVLAQIDMVWKNYEAAQNAMANRDQLAKKQPLRMGVPRDRMIDTSIINRVVPYFDMTIGICLLLGLFTPVAALAAAGFLGSVFISQFPPVTGPGSTFYQLIECMACLVIAATGAGRFAGLDFIFHTIVRKLWPRPAE
jgi:uncharacterized membrane protein YphA (DoxX/SURF4 family)